jgi:hypothetical protein
MRKSEMSSTVRVATPVVPMPSSYLMSPPASKGFPWGVLLLGLAAIAFLILILAATGVFKKSVACTTADLSVCKTGQGCVDKKCGTCKVDADCGVNQSCTKGKCVIKGVV